MITLINLFALLIIMADIIDFMLQRVLVIESDQYG